MESSLNSLTHIAKSQQPIHKPKFSKKPSISNPHQGLHINQQQLTIAAIYYL